MKIKLYSTDYVIVDSQTKKPLEGYEYISMTELPKEEKNKFKQSIKETEEFYNG